MSERSKSASYASIANIGSIRGTFGAALRGSKGNMELMDWMHDGDRYVRRLVCACGQTREQRSSARCGSYAQVNELLDRAVAEESGVPASLQSAFQEGSMATSTALDRAIEHGGMPRAGRRVRYSIRR
ncbi:TPA: hypothetical protein SAY52_001738 [Burkholderia cenocepacia]|uniref:hypothetical protein n=1 Tax=unclassified Burkholderia TaxID=2613784 RepID=UPI00158F15A7|nr:MULTISPECIES: hypothetical protein [unclassified Burkholderia]HEF5871148.1 hypothetical protein [Burkholderia cenocepacia]